MAWMKFQNTLIIKSWIKFDHMDEISDMDAMQSHA